MRKALSLTFMFLVLILPSSDWVKQAIEVMAAPSAGATLRVSLRTNDTEGNNDSFNADISADGRYVVFESDASNLVSNDTNGKRDIFLRDRVTGITERVSVSSSGQQGNFDSFSPAISDDGRIVVFVSWASNLVEGDTNNVADVFFHNRDPLLSSPRTKLVSLGLNGLPANNISYDPSYAADDPVRSLDISADGRYVVFQSFATNLVEYDTNGTSDIFRYDRTLNVTERISVTDSGGQAAGHSRFPTISADGQRIAFESEASNLVTPDVGGYKDIFVRNTSTRNTRLISVSSDEKQAQGDSFAAAISSDGLFVVFVSLAENLVLNDSNLSADVFIRDRSADTTEQVSVSSSETQANQWSTEASVSANGRYVVFQSRATNLVSGDPDDARDVFVRDRQTGTTVRASINSAGIIGNSSSRRPTIAAVSLDVVFESKATNLVDGDNNNARDIFVHQLIEPLPSATLAADAAAGKPGSFFGFTGANFIPNQAVEIWVNNSFLSNTIVSDGAGALRFVIVTTPSTAEGAYFVTVKQPGFEVIAGFFVSASANTQAATGPSLDLPGSVAPYTNSSYLPVVMR